MGLEVDLKKIVPISVVIPCYNAATTIERAVISVIRQTVLPEEIIIVDDKSTDDSRDALIRIKNIYGNVVNISVIKNRTNVGAGESRNRAWDKANGKYLAFLDADDAWSFDKLEVQYEIMVKNDDVDISCHKMSLNEEKNINSCKWLYVNKYRALFKNPMMTPSIMLKRSLPYRFKKDKRYAEDTFLWCEMLFNDLHVIYIDKTLARVFKPFYGSAGLSGELWKMEKGELVNFVGLYSARKINLPLLVVVCVFSIIKFIRRIIKVKIRFIMRRRCQHGERE